MPGRRDGSTASATSGPQLVKSPGAPLIADDQAGLSGQRAHRRDGRDLVPAPRQFTDRVGPGVFLDFQAVPPVREGAAQQQPGRRERPDRRLAEIDQAAQQHREGLPTSVNQVERWFAELTRKQLQRGVHRSTADLEADIAAFIDAHNENPKPYRWAKSADEILASVKRFCQKTQQNPCAEL